MKKSRLLVALCLFLLQSSVFAAPIGIYWSDIGAGTIQYSGLDGSGVTTLVNGLSNPQGLAVYGDSLFWTDRDALLIRQANSDGTNIQVLTNTAPGAPRGLSVNDDFIYWTNTGSTGVDSIWRMDRDGNNATALVTSGLSFPNDVSVTDNYIYWSDSGTTSIQRSDLNGSNIINVVSGLPTTHLPGSVFTTSDYLYWTTRDLALTQGGTAISGTIQRSNLDGTGITTIIDGLVFPQQAFVTSDFIYWTDQNTGKIQRSNLDGTGLTDIITGLITPVGLSVVTAPVSIPASVWLFGSGLLGLVGMARRKA